MNREKAIFILMNSNEYHHAKGDLPRSALSVEAFNMAIEALMDNKPSRTWIAKNEYRRGWHDAITKALAEVQKIYIENETFDMVQKETLIGLGLSMDSALGAEPYSETEESYPETDQPQWIPCSERLPEVNSVYLVTSEAGDCIDIFTDYWQGDSTWAHFGDRVIAWMPLPEPYKKEGDEE